MSRLRLVGAHTQRRCGRLRLNDFGVRRGGSAWGGGITRDYFSNRDRRLTVLSPVATWIAAGVVGLALILCVGTAWIVARRTVDRRSYAMAT